MPGVVYGIHLGESCGVHALVVRLGDFARPCFRAGQEGVDKGGFAHARIARKEGDGSAKFCLYLRKTLALGRRNFEAGIADGGVEVDEAVQIAQVVFIVEVGLVEEQDGGDAVGFGRGQEAVDEGGRSLRIVDGDDEHALVEVGGDDVRLLREVGRAADDVVLAVLYLGDKGRAFPVFNDVDTVAHGHGVGAADAFQAEVPLYLALHVASFVRANQVPAAGVFDYEACHFVQLIINN